eukprot:6477357-Amphidinium_carterae.1
MRGAVFALCGRNTGTVSNPKHELQLLEYYSQKQRLVTRSVWSAELYALCDAVDHSHILLWTLEQLRHGELSGDRARHLVEQGGFSTNMRAYTDSKSIFDAVMQERPKVTTERQTM